MDTGRIISGIRKGKGTPEREIAIRYLYKKGFPKFCDWLHKQSEQPGNELDFFKKGLSLLVLHISENQKNYENPLKGLQNLSEGWWIVEGSSLAHSDFIERLEKKSKSFLRSKGVDDSYLEDVFYEGLKTLIEKLREKKFEGRSKPEVYLNSTCWYVYLNLKKEEKRRAEAEEESLHTHKVDEDSLKEMIQKSAWVMKQVNEMKTNCKGILIDWVNGVSGKRMIEKYDFKSLPVVYVRINACKKNLRKQILKPLNKKCRDLLLDYFAGPQKKESGIAFKLRLMDNLNVSNVDELNSRLDNCSRRLDDLIINGDS